MKADADWEQAQLSRPSGIEYHGIAGSSLDCETAVVRLLVYGPKLIAVRIVTAGRSHCLLITNEVGDVAAIRSGFASGYGGTGPRTLSSVLQLLLSHGLEIDECDVDEALLDRIDQALITVGELDQIQSANPVRPSRWYGYIEEQDQQRAEEKTLWRFLRPTMPYSILEPRLIDLALTFWDDTDAALSKGYRRLEDVLRSRTGLKESSSRLFVAVFNGKEPKLTWALDDASEKEGRSALFFAVFKAFRNRRAHHENPTAEALTEFLLLNQLYLLEAEAVESAEA